MASSRTPDTGAVIADAASAAQYGGYFDSPITGQ